MNIDTSLQPNHAVSCSAHAALTCSSTTSQEMVFVLNCSVLPQCDGEIYLRTAALVSVALLPGPPPEDHSSQHHSLPMRRGSGEGGGAGRERRRDQGKGGQM